MISIESFEFSQSSLQDYVDCHKRFQLRHIFQLAWPAVQAEPIREFERHIRRGERFHRLAQQYLIGIPEDKLTRMAEADEDEHLQVWWEHFLSDIPNRINGNTFVEESLVAPLGSSNLIAKFDLILVQPDGQVIIFDWKTSPKKPNRNSLLERIQTRVYPYVLSLSGVGLNYRQTIPPDQVRMVYWFSEPGIKSEEIIYSEQQFNSDRQFLQSLVDEINTMPQEGFTLTTSERNCRYCNFRSLCDRGIRAALLLEGDDIEPNETENLDFNFEQIGEISY